MKTKVGSHSPTMRENSGQSARSSSFPPSDPAMEYGWHGMPPQTTST
jgi:hypothetical protein